MRVFTGPQAADRLAHGLVIFVLLQHREIEKAVLAGQLDGVEIGAGIGPQLAIFGALVMRGAERIAQRVGKLHALEACLLAVQPLDEQIGGLLVLAGGGNRQREADAQLVAAKWIERIADLAGNLRSSAPSDNASSPEP